MERKKKAASQLEKAGDEVTAAAKAHEMASRRFNEIKGKFQLECDAIDKEEAEINSKIRKQIDDQE